MANIGVILAGGIGTRFDSNIPKQYMKLNGQEVIAYSISAFKRSTQIDSFVVVVDAQEFESKNIENKYEVICIRGGETRNQSLYNAIIYIRENIPECRKVLFHEAARPFIKPEILDIYFNELDYCDAIITAAKITDSIGNYNQWYVDRKEFYLIQAPEAFDFNIISKHFLPNSNITATIQQLPSNIRLKKYFDFKNNLKITFPEDLFLAEQLIKLQYYHKNKLNETDYSKLDKVLIFGGSGGIGSQLVQNFKENNVQFIAPSHRELDLNDITVEKLNRYLGEFKPDVIINLAATSISDSDGIIENFETVFNVNLKSNLVFIEYARTLNKRVNLVLLSSSSSTKGRENITLYSASKVALNSIVESLSGRMYEKGIYINGIVPEKINTPLISKLHKKSIKINEMLDIEEVLDAILYYSSCDEYGQLVHVRKGL